MGHVGESLPRGFSESSRHDWGRLTCKQEGIGLLLDAHDPGPTLHHRGTVHSPMESSRIAPSSLLPGYEHALRAASDYVLREFDASRSWSPYLSFAATPNLRAISTSYYSSAPMTPSCTEVVRGRSE